MARLLKKAGAPAAPIWFVTSESWAAVREGLGAQSRRFADALGFSPASGKYLCLPGAEGELAGVLLGVDGAQTPGRDPLLAGKLATSLPGGLYRFANEPPGGEREMGLAALSWLLSAYSFRRYKTPVAEDGSADLAAPEAVDPERLRSVAEAIAFGRDLVNTPANDLGPAALEQATVALAEAARAKVKVIRGEQLLRDNFPLIYAVGRGAEEEPRLIDFVWGDEDAPKVTLVGKGVCFDSGGLDIKPASAMGLMKKDMAGAATALSLARMIMEASAPVRLRVLLPVVENAISAASFRPGDIYSSRAGLTVEIGNTDAEGRLILADALALADEEHPDLLLDFATLTGAARVALGPDLPPFYTRDERLAQEIQACAETVADPVWRMPLWPRYDALLDSKAASLNNVSSTAFAGSIVAALFLSRFISSARSWAHFDVYGWNPATRPGRPEGGEIQTARMLFDLIENRFRNGSGLPSKGRARGGGRPR